MRAGADMAWPARSAGQIGFGYDMRAVAGAENSKADAGHSLEVRILVANASPSRHAYWSLDLLLATLPLAETIHHLHWCIKSSCQQSHASLLQVADAAGTEVERRWAEPFRRCKIWKEVRAYAAAFHHASVPPYISKQNYVLMVIVETGTCRGEAREV